MGELIKAIENYFRICEREGAYHACRCAGCSSEKAALDKVLRALQEVARKEVDTHG